MIAPLTAYFAFRFSKKKHFALLAGGLAIFSGYYLPFITDTETFSLYFVLGSLFMLVSFTDWRWFSGKFTLLRPFIMGVIAGGMHLTRADGILWLAAGAGLVAWDFLRQGKNMSWPSLYRRIVFSGSKFLVLLFGYGLIMGPWYTRNIYLFGSLFSPGGSKTLWLTNYDQTFIYPASLLTWRAWAALAIGPTPDYLVGCPGLEFREYAGSPRGLIPVLSDAAGIMDASQGKDCTLCSFDVGRDPCNHDLRVPVCRQPGRLSAFRIGCAAGFMGDSAIWPGSFCQPRSSSPPLERNKILAHFRRWRDRVMYVVYGSFILEQGGRERPVRTALEPE